MRLIVGKRPLLIMSIIDNEFHKREHLKSGLELKLVWHKTMEFYNDSQADHSERRPFENWPELLMIVQSAKAILSPHESFMSRCTWRELRLGKYIALSLIHYKSIVWIEY